MIGLMKADLEKMVVRNNYSLLSGTILKCAWSISQKSSANIAGHCINI
jgi:hypothetical protein